MRSTMRAGALALATLIVVAACTGTAATPSPAPVTPAASASAAPTPDACARESLLLVTPGRLTIGTDNPAYPPYFSDETKDPAWELGNPNNGKGFESAVAYAVAKQLGFSADEVTWVVVPFANSYAPGPKTFDFDINQVSYKPERAQTADLSDGYYFGNQSLVVLKDSSLAKATTIAELSDGTFGAQVGTTSYDAIVNVIKPSKEARVYDTNDAAIEALKNRQIDGIIVDLPTADFITNVQVEGSVIVGQFEQGTPEHFSLVLSKGSALTPCANAAIKALTDDGTLKQLVDEWLPFSGVPVIQP